MRGRGLRRESRTFFKPPLILAMDNFVAQVELCVTCPGSPATERQKLSPEWHDDALKQDEIHECYNAQPEHTDLTYSMQT
jgi:hypothetical protein